MGVDFPKRADAGAMNSAAGFVQAAAAHAEPISLNPEAHGPQDPTEARGTRTLCESARHRVVFHLLFKSGHRDSQ